MELTKEKRQRTISTEVSNFCLNDKISNINNIVNSIFKKSFTICGNDRYTLPKPESMFNEESWEIEELQEIKRELNETKSKLNNFCSDKWHQHTSYRNKAKDIEWRIRKEFNPEFVTQAWCKFHEIISKYPLIPKESIFRNNNRFVSLHLCEAPGAFITCLNHWLKTNTPTIYWDWMAMTFNPYYEGNSNIKMISDDRFIIYTLSNWFFGRDNTGNLMTLDNLDALIRKSRAKGKVNLVTADGSVNCFSNPGEQEGIVVGLHFCEVVAAMHILETAGNFLLKIFTTFEHQSICLIFFLSCVFEKIHFYKPVTSKEGNSEVYLICLKFKGKNFVSPYLPTLKKKYEIHDSSKAMFCKNDIPHSFVEQIISCAEIFKNHQCQVIENNITTYFDDRQFGTNYELKKISKLVADKYITDFPVQKLHADLQIIGNMKLKKTRNNHWIVQPPAESFNEKQKKQILEFVYRLLMYKDQLNDMDLTPNTLEFKPISSCIDISITIGKPYRRVQSSRFCPVQIAEIYNLLFQAVEEEKKLICLPVKENVMDHEKNMKEIWNDSCKIINFQYTQIYENNRTLAYVREILKSLKKKDALIIYGFLLLTQFNVGLIHLLSNTFETVEFCTSEEIGCSITLKGFKSREIVLEKFEELHKAAESAVTNNLAVLSIKSVLELYDSDLYPIIVKINYWIAKYGVNYVFSINNE